MHRDLLAFVMVGSTMELVSDLKPSSSQFLPPLPKLKEHLDSLLWCI